MGNEPAGPLHELRLQEDGHEVSPCSPFATPIVRNSIVLVPDMLSASECDRIVDACESWVHERGIASAPLSRTRLSDLGEWKLGLHLLRHRLLPLLEESFPRTAMHLFGRATHLDRLHIELAHKDPAVNRYVPFPPGARFSEFAFPPHKDDFHLTMYVALDRVNTFTGGGTRFWHEDVPINRLAPPVSQLLAKEAWPLPTPAVEALVPLQGTAVLFNGRVGHAGNPVFSGTRHLLVLTFSLHTATACVHGARPLMEALSTQTSARVARALRVLARCVRLRGELKANARSRRVEPEPMQSDVLAYTSAMLDGHHG